MTRVELATTTLLTVIPGLVTETLVSIYGIDIGPSTAQSAQVTNGRISTPPGGVQVLFDGHPAALLYAGPTQINAIVPVSVSVQQTTTVQIVTPSGAIGGPTLTIQEALYGGDAPQLPSGVTQVNFRIPAVGPGSDGRLDFQVEVGGITSDFFYVYVQ